jgi:hypothetical protein
MHEIPLVSIWQVPSAESLEPDDLNQTEAVGVLARWFSGIQDEP